MNSPSEVRVHRFDAYERVTHWMAALSFVYAALTGLAIWSPKLWFLAPLLGGPVFIRGSHPWVGVLFSVVLGIMFKRWAKGMALDADDKVWLTKMERYAIHDHASLPPSGRFNAGQKMLFWSQVLTTLGLFATGVVLWFPEVMPRGLRLAAILLHPLTAIASIAGILVHIYMGTASVPYSMSAMLKGYVTPAWARSHHAKWYKTWKETGHS